MDDTTDGIEEKCRDFHGAVLTLLFIAGGLAVALAVWIGISVAALFR